MDKNLFLRVSSTEPGAQRLSEVGWPADFLSLCASPQVADGDCTSFYAGAGYPNSVLTLVQQALSC